MGEAWSQMLRQRAIMAWPEHVARLDSTFKFLPQEFRVGPWSSATSFVLASLSGLTAAAGPQALRSFEPLAETEELQARRWLGFLFGVSVLGCLVKRNGVWPLATWTMLGWTTATLRYLAGALGLGGVQRVLTFPSICANCLTFLLWYFVMLPGILILAPTGQTQHYFKTMVMSLLMFTVHGINLPFSLADWYMQPMRLTFFDLWAGIVYTLAYGVWYLFILDPLGAHLYFIFTPRRWWSTVVYVGILLLTYFIWIGINNLEAQLDGSSMKVN